MEPMAYPISDPVLELMEVSGDASALFEQYEPGTAHNDALYDVADTCENLYAIPA